MRILDVGAGYGRLAHRMVQSLGNIKEYVCADAVPVSTLICDYYLKFRACEGRAAVLPLDELETGLADRRIDLAINIHSFSECRTSAIDWWLSLLARHRVRYLMIVPNTPRKTVGETLLTNDGHDFGGIVTKHGYSLVAREPKYRIRSFSSTPSIRRTTICSNCANEDLLELRESPLPGDGVDAGTTGDLASFVWGPRQQVRKGAGKRRGVAGHETGGSDLVRHALEHRRRHDDRQPGGDGLEDLVLDPSGRQERRGGYRRPPEVWPHVVDGPSDDHAARHRWPAAGPAAWGRSRRAPALPSGRACRTSGQTSCAIQIAPSSFGG